MKPSLIISQLKDYSKCPTSKFGDWEGRVLEKWNNQEDKSSLKNIDDNVGTYEKIVEPIQEDKDWEIYRQKLTEQIHYSRQPFCVGCGMTVEGFDNLIKKTKQESYEEGMRVRSKYMQNKMEEARLEERNRIIKAIKEKGLHLGYKNDILDIINSLREN